jgi:hypothetical protein
VRRVTVLLRVVVAGAVLVSGVVHLKLWVDGYRDIPVVGPMFLLNVVAAGVIAVAVLVWRHWLPPLAAVGLGAATLGAFVVSTTVGLFGVHEVWTGADVLTAALSEAVAVVAGVALLVRQLPGRRGSGSEHEHRGSGHRSDLH